MSHWRYRLNVIIYCCHRSSSPARYLSCNTMNDDVDLLNGITRNSHDSHWESARYEIVRSIPLTKNSYSALLVANLVQRENIMRDTDNRVLIMRIASGPLSGNELMLKAGSHRIVIGPVSKAIQQKQITTASPPIICRVNRVITNSPLSVTMTQFQRLKLRILISGISP
uniref:Orf7 n=1 Tax=Yersinia enterocolitica TaxID=630 RepID=Q9KKI0_YEREN|nr:Orf7 [Yersinia enterocolitica]AAK84127.1 unknown [Yersinia enterocolitica]